MALDSGVEWGAGGQPPARQDHARLPRTSDGEGHSQLRSLAAGQGRAGQGPRCPAGLTAGGGAVLGAPPLAPPKLSLSRSRLQPSRLLLSLLHRLKTATVPELTPGDPERFLPHPRAHSTLCSPSLLNSGRRLGGSSSPTFLTRRVSGELAQGQPHCSRSSPPLRRVGAGPLQGGQAGPSSLRPLPSCCPHMRVQASGKKKVGKERR